MHHIQETLNKNIYGLEKVKEKILETICAMILDNNCKNRCITLVGPPGVGKTSIVKSLAEALGLPYEYISLGGIKDSSYLLGHSYTYIGAKPGIIVNMLRNMKYKNGIVLFDEIDKVSKDNNVSDIYSVLLNIFDYTQNHQFRDNYIPEIPIDLSNLFMVIAMNDDTHIDTILKDRLSIIYLNGYNQDDKIHIAKNYLIPKIIKDKELVFSDEIISYIVSLTKNDSGIRKLERIINNIYLKYTILKQTYKKTKRPKLSYNITNFKLPFILIKNHVDLFLI